MLQSLLGFKLKFEDSNSRIQMFGFWIFLYGSRKHKSNNNSKINAFWGVCTTFSIHDTPLTPRIHIRLILHKQTKKARVREFPTNYDPLDFQKETEVCSSFSITGAFFVLGTLCPVSFNLDHRFCRNWTQNGEIFHEMWSFIDTK